MRKQPPSSTEKYLEALMHEQAFRATADQRSIELTHVRRRVEAIETYLEHAICTEYTTRWETYERATTLDCDLSKRLERLKRCVKNIPSDVTSIMFLNCFGSTVGQMDKYKKTRREILKVLENA